MESLRRRGWRGLSSLCKSNNSFDVIHNSELFPPASIWHRFFSRTHFSARAFPWDSPQSRVRIHLNAAGLGRWLHDSISTRRALSDVRTGVRCNAANGGFEFATDPDVLHGKSSAAISFRKTGAILASLLGAGLIGHDFLVPPVSASVLPDNAHAEKSSLASLPPAPLEETITNWSATHEVHTSALYRPETLEELEALVALAHEKSLKLRPVGSGISPNGIGLNEEGMVNIGHLDKVLEVDLVKMQVKVQAGARVEQVVEALRPYNLTLQNYASVREQQIGGFIQVSAHGTGVKIPPVDEQVIGLKVVTPGKGTIELSRTSDPDLLDWFKCSLGTLGVIAEVTLQCVPAHKLVEHTFVTTRDEVRKNHKKWILENKHLRYMWIPYTDDVVVVRCNDYNDDYKYYPVVLPEYERQLHQNALLKPVREFYLKCVAEKGSKLVEDNNTKTHQSQGSGAKGVVSTGTSSRILQPKILTEKEINNLSFTELRDCLLALDPLNHSHVEKVNLVEAEYWKKCEGFRIGWSDEILGFDCGGQQWVSEVAFPAFSMEELQHSNPELKDLDFVESVLNLIKKEKIAAPSPIEQRWTKSSQSLLSPVHGYDPSTIYSWVGIIMYLCSEDSEVRDSITQKFFEYKHSTAKNFWDSFEAQEHWAKIELPEDEETKKWLKDRLHNRFPIYYWNRLRDKYDPKNILSNSLIDELFPREVNAF